MIKVCIAVFLICIIACTAQHVQAVHDVAKCVESVCELIGAK